MLYEVITIIIESTEQVQNAPTPPIVEQTQQFPTYQQAYAEEQHIERQSTLNGVSYFPNTPPPPKKKKGKVKKFFKGVALVACAVIIAGGSVSGYIALTNNDYEIPFFSSMVKKDSASSSDGSSSTSGDAKETINNKNVPTLEQLASYNFV